MPAAQDINPQTGKAYAVNPQTGVWDDNYFANNFGGVSKNTSSFNTTSPLDTAKQVQSFYQEQNKPVIASYEASKTPLKQRYDDLIASIKGNQQIAENRQTVTTANEFGKRGLSNTSGIAQQEMTNALNPITQQYTGMIKDTTNQENIDMSAIDKVIAQLQAGNPESAVSAGMGLYNTGQTLDLQKQQLAETQKQNAINNAIAQIQKQYLTLGEGQTVYDPNTGKAMYTAPKTYKDVQSNLGWE